MHLSHTCLSSQFAFNQHEFLKGGTQKESEDLMLATLKESIRVPGKMICLLHGKTLCLSGGCGAW